MILTQIQFTRPVLTDSHITHSTVLSALTDPGGRVLWAAPTRRLLIVQAPEPVTGPMRHVADRSHKPARTRWDKGAALRLALIANPVRAQHVLGSRGKRTPLPLPDCETWLRRKLADAVHLDQVHAQDLGTRTGTRHGQRVYHRLVAFIATGRVTDPDRLERLLIDGVGPGKAYGAGLLLAVAA